jgi:hypothetical protein
MASLMYNSSNDELITRDQMQHLITPPPLGPRHAPYPFADFCDDTVGALERSGFEIQEEEYAVNKEHTRLFGLLSIAKNSATNGGLGAWSLPETVRALVPITQPDWGLLVGLRGSHDQAFSRALTIGAKVYVCSNLGFMGDLGVWNTKQTLNIVERMPSLIEGAVQGVRGSAQTLSIEFDAFSRTDLSRDQGDDLLLDVYRSGGLSPSQLGKAVDDWTKCSVEEHTVNGRNLWWLFNSATQALKPGGANSNHNDLRDRSMIIYRTMRPVAGPHLESLAA